ncbi:MAG: hypothetical protein LBC96_00275 [Lachnospiraceae bacterium]|nr:hypothetical protein [Lachnospiraceae bacterium]
MYMIKSYRYFIVCISLSTIFLLCSCDERSSDASDRLLSDVLISQISWEADEYLLSLLSDELVDKDVITLKSIIYGSFTNVSEEQILASFHVNAPHAATLDRTIVAIYDSITMKIVSQKTFAADTVCFYVLHGVNSHILFIGDVTYQGISVYKAELYEILDNQWIVKKIIDEPLGETSYYYSFTNGIILHLFAISYDEYRNPLLQHKDTLYWQGDEFVRR